MSELRADFVDKEKIHDSSNVKSSNFELALVCTLCHAEISPKSGDVIFGDNWYHGLCWELLNKRPEGN